MSGSLLTHGELVTRAERWLRGTKKCRAIITEPTAGVAMEQPDAIGWRRGWFSILVECKVSRADFRADANKLARRHPSLGMGSERWFFTNPGIAVPEDLPEHWGLIEIRGSRAFVVKAAVENAFQDRPHHREILLLVAALGGHQEAEWSKVSLKPIEKAPKPGAEG